MTKIDKKEILNSFTKSAFSLIPIAGTALTELVFEYNGRIKQNRLNRFIEILAEYFTENNDINIDNIKTEDFNDLFETVLKRVVTTKSELKLNRFKDILIKELKNPTKETELIDLYLDLISSLSEEELKVLYNHRHFDKKHDQEIDEQNTLRDKLTEVLENKKKETIIIGRSKYAGSEENYKDELSRLKHKHKYLLKYRNAKEYGIEEQKFIFYKQRLYSKGLLLDSGINRIGYEPFQLMSITEFGLEFIEFIKSEENKTTGNNG